MAKLMVRDEDDEVNGMGWDEMSWEDFIVCGGIARYGQQ